MVAVNSAAALREFAKQNGFASFPLEIAKLIQFLNIRIEYEDMDRELSGYIEKRITGWVIGVNKYHSDRRRRFTLAHELGHFLLHKDKIDAGRKTESMLFRDEDSSPIEREANEFASDLLIPRPEFVDAIRNGVVSIDALSDIFGVSVAAIRYKAHKLGYLGKY
jgi:Zn-dependent peptidase ImmA (M78 family)